MAKRPESHLDEIVARTGLIEQRTEKHEKEHELGGHSECDAKHALRRDPHMAHRLAQGRARPTDLVGHHFRRAEEHIEQENDRKDHHHRAKHTVRCDEQQDQPGEGEIGVRYVRKPAIADDLVVEEIAIEREERACDAQHPVIDRDAVARAGFEQRVGHGGQKHCKGQMDLAGVVDQISGQHIGRHGRGQQDLKDRPGEGDGGDEGANCAAWAARPAVAGSDKLLQLCFAQRAALCVRHMSP